MVKRVILVLEVIVGLGLVGAGQGWGQTNVAKADRSANRYLLVVETSRSMKERASGVLNAVGDLLASDMDGQFRPGDELGIWTFNADLHTGRFPLQRWSLAGRRSLTNTVLSFLNAQKYEKASRIGKVLPVLDQVIKHSEYITVILVSGAEQEIQGTPFDKEINDSYKLWRGEQQKARMPLLTVLRAKRGEITGYSVNAAPFPVDMPPLPPELMAAEAGKKATAPPPKPPPATSAPLIVHGKKPEPTVPVVAAPPAEPPKTNTVSEAPAKPAPEPPVTPAAKLEPSTATPSNLPAAVAPTAQSGTMSPVTNVSITNAPTTAVPTSNAAAASVTAAKADASQPAASNPVAVSGPIQSAVAPVAETRPDNKRLWTTIFILGGVILILLVMLARRRRSAGGASLITRSLDREDPQ